MRHIIFLIFLFIYQNGFTQITFNHRQNLGFDAFGYSSVVPVDSGYFLTGLGAIGTQFQGHTQSVFAFADTLGQIVWHKAIIGEGGRNMGAFEGNFRQKNDTSFITVGVEFGGGWNKACLYNYNGQGDTTWVRKFFSPVDTGYIKAEAFTFANDGGFLIGSSIQPNTDLDTKILLMKTDSVGNKLWHRIYGSSSLYYREEWPILRNINGQIVLVSWYWKYIWATTSNYDMQHQFWWLDNVGNVLNTYTTPNIKPNTTNIKWQLGLPRDLIKTKDGGWLMGTSLGTEDNSPPVNDVLFDPYIYKLDSNLGFQWERKITSIPQGYITEIDRIFEQADSSLIAIGSVGIPSFFSGMIMKLSPQGDSIWLRHYYYLTNNLSDNSVYDAKPTPDGGYIICGEANSYSGGTPQQGWLLKLDSMGCLVPGCHLTAVENVAGDIHVPIKVFPNPATDYINIYIPKIQSGSGFQLHLYDLSSRLLQNHALPQSDATYMLTTEGLENGLYILQVLDDGGRIIGTEKVVVSK